MNQARDARRRELAKIHLAKKQLGLDDATYRAILHETAGVESAAKLDGPGRRAVLAHLERCGFKPKRGKPHPGQPHNLLSTSRGPLLRKIEALLADKGKREERYVPWSYALGILKRQGGPEKIEWASPEQLQAVIAALSSDARRKGRKRR